MPNIDSQRMLQDLFDCCSDSACPGYDMGHDMIPHQNSQPILSKKKDPQNTLYPLCQLLSSPSRFSLSFLSQGSSFHGSQNLLCNNTFKEEWIVKVTIHHVDYKRGTICGLMEAIDVPEIPSSVYTFWEGEMVDFVHHSLWTNKWQATKEVDLKHWRKFEPFRRIPERCLEREDLFVSTACKINEKYIFMRWKERNFVNKRPENGTLTIAGFYYICMRRSDGYIEGFYYEPATTPYQKIMLTPTPTANGHSFSQFSFT